MHHLLYLKRRPLNRVLFAGVLGSMPLLPAMVAYAEAVLPATVEQRKQYDIPAGPLDQALNRFATDADLMLSVDARMTEGKRSDGLRGRFTPEEGLQRLLEGTGLEAAQGAGGNYIVQRASTHTAVLPAVDVTADAENAWGPVQGYVAKRSATATKTGSEIIETPQSVSVISAQRIEAMGATTVKDVLAYTPGVDIAPYGADSRYDWITIRGFDAISPGFYMDGLQLRHNAWWAVWQTENYGLERIEIMRGPSSVLYGQGSPGGLVNMVTKRPTTERINEIQLQIGSDSRKQVAGDFAGAINEDGSLSYRVVGLARDGELPAEGMPDDRYYFAPSLKMDFSDATSLTLQAQWLKSRAGVLTRSLPEEGSLIPTPIGTYLPRDVFTGEPDFNALDQEQWMLGYLFEHRPDDTWTLRQNLRYGELETLYAQVYGQSAFVEVNPANPADPLNFRVLERGMSGSDEQIQSIVIDNQVQADFTTGVVAHTVLLGLDYQRSRFDQVSYFSGTVDFIDLYAPEYGSAVIPGPVDVDTWTQLEQAGLYLQDQMKLDRWVATLAVRHDRASIDSDDRLTLISTEQDDEKPTGRAGIIYLHPNGLAPYLSYSTSFSPTTSIDPETGNPFDPETGRQLETGIRYQPSAGNAMYSAAIFELQRQNTITNDPTTSIPRQTGEITVRGLELEIVAELFTEFNFTASYAYTPSANVTASEEPEEIGKQDFPVPRHRGSVWGDYRFSSGFRLGGGGRYVGSTRGIVESAVTSVPHYTVFDALLGYDVAQWSLTLNAHNLTDEDFISTCGHGACYYGDMGRRVLLTAAYQW